MINIKPNADLETSSSSGDPSEQDAGWPISKANYPTVEVAQYIGELSHELAVLARHGKLDLLAHFLELASKEAQAAANRLS